MTESPMTLPDDEHDQRLRAAVQPPDWVNPRPTGRYNLVVVGAGTAGLVCAAGAAGLGAKVALIERRMMGGDCLNFGCVPSKALIRSARVAAQVQGAAEFGVEVAPPRVRFDDVMARMRRLRANLSGHDSAERFRRLGVDVFLGEGRFVAADTVEVAGQRLAFARAVIATGGRPDFPPIPGLAEAAPFTNETIFALTAPPKRLAILGAGAVGVELAQALARLGVDVALITRGPCVMPKEEPAASAIVLAALARDGVHVGANAQVRGVTIDAGKKRLEIVRAGQVETIEADAILLATGRKPNLEGLGLESADVRVEQGRGLIVDDFLRTTNPRIYAAGDVCSPFRFTHAADAMARIVLRNALFFGRARMSRLVIPWCTFTDPEVARVGLSEAEARDRNVAYRAFEVGFDSVDRAILDGQTEGFIRVLVEPKRGRIVGATVVAAHAGEMISELALAMTRGIGLGALANVIHPYPTQAEAIKRVGDAFNRSRLTPLVASLFRRVLAWRR